MNVKIIHRCIPETQSKGVPDICIEISYDFSNDVLFIDDLCIWIMLCTLYCILPKGSDHGEMGYLITINRAIITAIQDGIKRLDGKGRMAGSLHKEERSRRNVKLADTIHRIQEDIRGGMVKGIEKGLWSKQARHRKEGEICDDKKKEKMTQVLLPLFHPLSFTPLLLY